MESQAGFGFNGSLTEREDCMASVLKKLFSGYYDHLNNRLYQDFRPGRNPADNRDQYGRSETWITQHRI